MNYWFELGTIAQNHRLIQIPPCEPALRHYDIVMAYLFQDRNQLLVDIYHMRYKLQMTHSCFLIIPSTYNQK